jgi:hypothetical protein
MADSKTVRFKENPFLEALTVNKKDKRINVNPISADREVLVNQVTGEIKGTLVTTFRSVDDAKFVKLFTQNIALTFDLKSAGIKAFNILMFTLQDRFKTDTVTLDKFALEEFITNHANLKLSESTFLRGLRELETAQIIAKTMRRGVYFINPSFVFNGDRIAFTTIIERKKNNEKDLGVCAE